MIERAGIHVSKTRIDGLRTGYVVIKLELRELLWNPGQPDANAVKER